MQSPFRLAAVTVLAAAAILLTACAPSSPKASQEEFRESVTGSIGAAGYTVTSARLQLDGFSYDARINIDGSIPYTADDLRTIILAGDDGGASPFAPVTYSFEHDDGYQDVCAAAAELSPELFCTEAALHVGNDDVAVLRAQ